MNMSELMTQAIIKMPYELVMGDELSRKQFYDRAQQVLNENHDLQQKLLASQASEARLRDLLERSQNGLRWYQDEHPDDDSEADGELHDEIDTALSTQPNTAELESFANLIRAGCQKDAERWKYASKHGVFTPFGVYNLPVGRIEEINNKKVDSAMSEKG
jgi:hypothetical protein